MTEFDELLLKTYMQGFNDELKSKKNIDFKLLKKAYELGRDHAIIGDEVRSVDYLTDKEILKIIKK